MGGTGRKQSAAAKSRAPSKGKRASTKAAKVAKAAKPKSSQPAKPGNATAATKAAAAKATAAKAAKHAKAAKRAKAVKGPSKPKSQPETKRSAELAEKGPASVRSVREAPPPVGRFDLAAARAAWFARQGLGATPVAGSMESVVAKTGWLRTLGGADVYIAARARRPSLSRAELDGVVAHHQLRVLPAARGCIYLVPQEHALTALHFAEAGWRKRTDRELVKAGSSWREVADVGAAVLQALAGRPLATDALRRALPADAVRSLGDAGKKVGLSSPLPVALRELEFRGAIERTLEQGRLDTERYVWRTADSSPLDTPEQRTYPALVEALAAIFFAQMGPATTGDFAEWAGVTKGEAQAAIQGVGLLPVAIDGYAEVAWVDEAGLPALSQPAIAGDHVTFLSFEDNYLVPHGGPRHFCDPAHHDLRVHSWGTLAPTRLGDAKHLATRTILIGDRVAGFWEYDAEAQEVVTWLFEAHPAELGRHIEVAATSFARFLFEDVGHARSFSLDTDDAVRERANALRSMPAR